MDITGQYLNSFSIKGQPFDEEFKIVLEASISVYDKSGLLQTNIVSKLNSKPMAIKSMMKSQLKEGLDLTGVIFGEQEDEEGCGQAPGKGATVRQKLDAKKQNEARTRRSAPAQKLRLDCFWAHLPDSDIENASPKVDAPVQKTQTITNQTAPGITFSNPGIFSADGSQFNGVYLQPLMFNVLQATNQPPKPSPLMQQKMNTVAAKLKAKRADKTRNGVKSNTTNSSAGKAAPVLQTTNQPHNQVMLAQQRTTAFTAKHIKQEADSTSIVAGQYFTESGAEQVVPVGLPYRVKQEPIDIRPPGNDFPELRNNDQDTDTIAANKESVDSHKHQNNNIADLFSVSSVIQSTQIKFERTINETEKKTSQTMQEDDCSAQLREIPKTIQELSQMMEKDDSVSQLRTLNLDHTYKRAEQMIVPNEHKCKAGNPRKRKVENAQKQVPKSMAKKRSTKTGRARKAIVCSPRKSNILNEKEHDISDENKELETKRPKLSKEHVESNETSLLNISCDEIKIQRTESDIESDSENTKKPKASNVADEKHETDMLDMSLGEIKIERVESDIENDNNESRRKRRRCTRNVNYKALAQTYETDESDKGESDPEPSYSDVDCSEPEDSDYKEPRDFGTSESEDSVDEEDPLLLGLDEDKVAKILEQIEKNRQTKAKKKHRKRAENIKVKVDLSEHQDKFEIVQTVSSEQRNRGKPIDEISHNSYACKICNEFEVVDEESMSLHIGQHLQGNFRCKECELELPSLRRKIDHVKDEHPSQFSDERSRKMCEQCGILFGQRKSHCIHMFKVHKIPSFECQLCTKKGAAEFFATQKDLYRHEKEKHLEDLFICNKCDKHFNRAQKYTFHANRCSKDNNSKDTVFQCSECSFTSKQKNSYTVHVKRVHRKEKNAKCELCDFKAYTHYSVKRHMAHAHLGKIQGSNWCFSLRF